MVTMEVGKVVMLHSMVGVMLLAQWVSHLKQILFLTVMFEVHNVMSTYDILQGVLVVMATCIAKVMGLTLQH